MDDSTETSPRDWPEREGGHHGSLTDHIYLERPLGAFRIPHHTLDLAGLTGRHRREWMRARLLHQPDRATDGQTQKNLHSLGVEPTRRHPAHKPGRIAPHRLDCAQSRPQCRPHTEGTGAAAPTFMEPRPLQYTSGGHEDPRVRTYQNEVIAHLPGIRQPVRV